MAVPPVFSDYSKPRIYGTFTDQALLSLIYALVLPMFLITGEIFIDFTIWNKKNIYNIRMSLISLSHLNPSFIVTTAMSEFSSVHNCSAAKLIYWHIEHSIFFLVYGRVCSGYGVPDQVRCFHAQPKTGFPIKNPAALGFAFCLTGRTVILLSSS